MNYALKKNIAELTNCSVEEYREVQKFPFAVLLDNVLYIIHISEPKIQRRISVSGRKIRKN